MPQKPKPEGEGIEWKKQTKHHQKPRAIEKSMHRPKQRGKWNLGLELPDTQGVGQYRQVWIKKLLRKGKLRT